MCNFIILISSSTVFSKWTDWAGGLSTFLYEARFFFSGSNLQFLKKYQLGEINSVEADGKTLASESISLGGSFWF